MNVHWFTYELYHHCFWQNIINLSAAVHSIYPLYYLITNKYKSFSTHAALLILPILIWTLSIFPQLTLSATSRTHNFFLLYHILSHTQQSFFCLHTETASKSHPSSILVIILPWLPSNHSLFLFKQITLASELSQALIILFHADKSLLHIYHAAT